MELTGTPKKVETKSCSYRQIYATSVIYQDALIRGIGITLTAFVVGGQDDVTVVQESLLGSLSQCSRPVGSILCMLLIDNIGRKFTSQISLMIHITGWSFIAFSPSYMFTYAGRVLIGIASGMQAGGIYVSEIVNKSGRGKLMGLKPVFTTIGTSIPLILGAQYTWRTLAFIALGFSITGLIQLSFLPDTKYWYIFTKQRQKAKESFLWYEKNATAAEIEDQLQDIEQSIIPRFAANKFSICSTLTHRKYRKNFFVLLSLIFCATSFGRISVATHLQHFFQAFNTPYEVKDLVVFLSIADLVCSLSFIWLIDVFKRKSLINFSLGIMAFCLTTILIHDLVLSQLNLYFSILPTALIIIYLLVRLSCFMMSFNVLKNELIFHPNRGVVLTISTLFNDTLGGIYAYIMPFALMSFGVHVILFYFLVNLVVLAVLVRTVVPETSGKDLHKCTRNETDEDVREPLIVNEKEEEPGGNV